MIRVCYLVFARDAVEGSWKWGVCLTFLTYLGIDIQCNGAWDAHIKRVIDSGRKKVSQLHSVISNRDVNFNVHTFTVCSEAYSTVWE